MTQAEGVGVPISIRASPCPPQLVPTSHAQRALTLTLLCVAARSTASFSSVPYHTLRISPPICPVRAAEHHGKTGRRPPRR